MVLVHSPIADRYDVSEYIVTNAIYISSCNDILCQNLV